MTKGGGEGGVIVHISFLKISNFCNLLRQKKYNLKTSTSDMHKPLGVFPFVYLFHFSPFLSRADMKK